MISTTNESLAPAAALRELCEASRITELAVFGSATRDDFRPDSDIDLLVTFQSGHRHSLFDLLRLESDFADLFGRRVDLIERAAVETNPNKFARHMVLDSAQVIYRAG